VVQIGTSDPQDEGMKQSTVDQEVKVQGHARQCSLASAFKNRTVYYIAGI